MPYNFEVDYTIEERKATLGWRSTLANKIDGNAFTQAQLDAMKNLALDITRQLIDEPQVTANKRETALSLGTPTAAARVDNKMTIQGSPSGDASPSWSHDNTKIAYLSNLNTATLDLHTMNADGTNVARIYGDIEAAAWSQVDNRIAIVLNSTRDIYTINPDGTNLIKLTDLPGTPFIYGLAWSPDSRQIAFNSNHVDGYQHIFIYDLFANTLTQVTSTTTRHDSNPTWSPDGSQIAFNSNRGTTEQQINIVTVDTGVITRLTSDPEGNTHPAWSPVENKIVFINTNGAKTDTDIYTMKSDGTGRAELTTNAITGKGDLKISPNGRRIVFIQPSGIPNRVFTAGVMGNPVSPEYRHEWLMRNEVDYHNAWAYDYSERFRVYATATEGILESIVRGRTKWPYRESDPIIVDKSLLRNAYRDLREGETPPPEVVGKLAPPPPGV